MPDRPSFASVLVVRLSALGDILFAAPAVQALHRSGAARRLAWLVEDRAAALVRLLPGLDEVVVFPRGRKRAWPGHALALLRRRDDLVLDLQGSLKSRLQLQLLRRVPRRVGYAPPIAREGAQRACSETVQLPVAARHRVAQAWALVGSLGVPVPPRAPRPELAIPPEALQRARAFAGSLPGDGPLVVLQPGTSAFGAFKRWDPTRFGALGAALARERGARLVVGGSPAERVLVEAVRLELESRGARSAIPPPGGVPELAALLASADLVVASDSLPLHLANALGTPAVGLYGPKDPTVTGPYWDRAAVLRSGVACSPCTLRRCRDTLCMQRLEPDAVLRAAEELLDGRDAPAAPAVARR